MDTLAYRQGETLQLPITIDDVTAEQVVLTVWNDADIIYDDTTASASFTNGQATIDAVNSKTGDVVLPHEQCGDCRKYCSL